MDMDWDVVSLIWTLCLKTAEAVIQSAGLYVRCAILNRRYVQ